MGEVGEVDLGLGALDADGAEKEAHLVLLPGEDMLDAGADFRFGGVGLCFAFGHGLAARFLAVNAADPALALDLCLVGLAAVGGVGPDVGSGVVGSDGIAQHSPVKACAVGDLAFSDETEGPADRHAALVAEARDGDADTWVAVRQRPRLGKHERPARVGALLRCPGRLIGPDLACALA